MSSNLSNWETPHELFKKLNMKYRFQIDVCASKENAKCQTFFTEDIDGLSQEWNAAICWMNPPYGRAIGKWMKKAYEESLKGATVVCLVPARTDTAWWHDFAMKGKIEFLRGRVKFIHPVEKVGRPAPFPSAIVVFNDK
jgi:phage N-6-adenine-methyltransferase